MDYVLMGAQIRARRITLGMTQAELAERVSVSTAFIGHIERGTRIPSLATMVSIAAALHVTVDALLPGHFFPEDDLMDEPAKALRLLALALRLTETAV